MPVMSFFQKLSIRISPKLDSNSGPRSNGISPFPNDNSKVRDHKTDGSNNTSKDTHINPPKSSPPRTLNSTSMLIDTSTSPNFNNNNNNNNNNSNSNNNNNNSNGNNQTNSTDIVNNNTKKTNATTASSRSNSKKNNKTNVHPIPQMRAPQHPLEDISSGSDPTAQAVSKDKKLSLTDFDLCRTLGTGSFGRVHLVQSKHNQKFYAMKVLKKTEVVRLKQVEHTNNEKRILTEISHPFVVKLWGTFQDPTNLYMVMDYVVGGELFSVLRKAQRFENHVAKFYAAEVLLAFEYLHSKDIIYRDLKPENLLLDRKGHIKITDFGFAKRVLDVTWTLCGTPDYLAPEVIQSKGYSKAVDWYSLGILIFEMLAGYPPFYDEDHVRLYEKILSGRVKYPNNLFDSNVKDLLKRLLTADLSKRYGNLKGGSEDIKQHPWFKAVDWDRLLKIEIDAPYIPTVAGEGDASNFDLYPEEKEPYGKPGPDNHRDKFKSF